MKAKELKNGELIIATFRGGKRTKYTTAIYWLLVTDPAVVKIEYEKSGEILYEQEISSELK